MPVLLAKTARFLTLRGIIIVWWLPWTMKSRFYGFALLEHIGHTTKSMLKLFEMNIKPIKTKRDYREALKRMQILWGSKSATPEGNELDILATLADNYEEINFPIEAPDPVE